MRYTETVSRSIDGKNWLRDIGNDFYKFVIHFVGRFKMLSYI